MGWLFEFIIEGFWDYAVLRAYRSWGWAGGAIVLLGPFALAGLAIWLLVR